MTWPSRGRPDRRARWLLAPANNKGFQAGNQYASKAQAQQRVAEAATYKPPTGTSVERRFATLRRNHPEIAERLLAGDDRYFRTTEHGCSINWEAVNAATGAKPKPSLYAR